MTIDELKVKSWDLGKKLNDLQKEADKILPELNAINKQIEEMTTKEK